MVEHIEKLKREHEVSISAFGEEEQAEDEFSGDQFDG